MKVKELKQKTTSELQLLLKEDRAKLQQLRFDLASKKLKNINELRFIKREIARILTIFKKEEKIHD